ncbi:MAG TPA: DUF5312 family protein [Spirochaetales bacterium]|nr:hypothetical protein [Spirochaetales bacterium]MBP7264919.1 hypothetical protein [Spirochaetia bacterium]HPE36156.1 DUF5312 family protein [Spirochaetales bacterium]
MARNDAPTARGEESPGGFFQRILGMFGMGDPDADKKRLIKQLGKDLAHSRYRFYRPKTGEVLTGLARFFYETYKTVAPAQVLLTNAAQSGVLKSFVIESFLTKDQRALAERLTDAYLNTKAATMSVKDLQELVKQDMISFFSVFDAEKTSQIDGAYSTLLSFINFINFDYFFLLKKFDSNITERSFTYVPKFDAIAGDYVADDIHDFLEVFLPLNLEADWKRIFTALKEYRNMDVIQVDAWLKLIPALKDVRANGVLEQIVRHVKKDPMATVSPRATGERIVEPFIDKLKNQTTILLQKIVQERRSNKIEELSKAVFGTSVVVRLKNYTDKANVVFAKKMLGGYTQTASLNYLKAYLIDYFKKDVRELVDILLIRGQWSANVQSQQLSDGYHALLDVSDAIIQFDDSLADDGDQGMRLRNALMKSDRDKDQLKYVRQILKDINDKALALVNKSALNMIAVGRHIKGLLDDLSKPHHEILLNWKEVENASAAPMKSALADNYRKIYYMVQLLQYYVKADKE